MTVGRSRSPNVEPEQTRPFEQPLLTETSPRGPLAFCPQEAARSLAALSIGSFVAAFVAT